MTCFTQYPLAHPAGYGTNDVPNPPYIGYETAYVSAIRFREELFLKYLEGILL